MNQAGRDALRAAWLAGVKQIVGRLRDADGGRCAMGVLEDASSVSHESLMNTYDLRHRTILCPLCVRPRRRLEGAMILHLNDKHRADFAKIASLMPVTDAP